jgi:phosphohistidine phosphatase
MALFLVQHGKSLPKDTDPGQGLSKEGIAETQHIAENAKDCGVKISLIKHSGKTRARRTAEIFASTLQPDKGIQETAGIKPLDDVAAFAKNLSCEDDIMLVGHLPFMERMTSYLISGSIEKPVLKFQNSGIVCLDKDPETKFWYIKWTLMPRIE